MNYNFSQLKAIATNFATKEEKYEAMEKKCSKSFSKQDKAKLKLNIVEGNVMKAKDKLKKMSKKMA